MAASSGSIDPTTSSGAADGGTTTTDDPGAPIDCEHLCDAPWTHAGDLWITPETDPATLHCLQRVDGLLEIVDFTGPLPQELLALREVESLIFNFNDGLVDLHGLECLQRIDDFLGFEGNDALVDVSALAGVTTVQRLFFQSNDGLVDLTPLSNAVGVEWLLVNSCRAVTKLPNFPPGTRIDVINIWYLPLLGDLDALAGLEGSPGQLGLSNLSALTSVAGLSGLWGPNEPPGEVSMVALPQLASLAGLEGLEHATDIYLRDLPVLESLAALAGLRSTEFLSLSELPKLTSLVDLAGLQTIGRLELGDCASVGLSGLVDMTGLGGVTELDVLHLQRNDALQSLAGFDGLVSGPTLLEVAENPQLASEEVAAFAAAHAVPEVCQVPPDACGCDGL